MFSSEALLNTFPAVEFLLGNGFSIDAICKHGVRYLSRKEEADAVERANQKLEPAETVEVKDSDQESLEFLRVVRGTIDAWMKPGVVCAPVIYYKSIVHYLTILISVHKSISTSRPRITCNPAGNAAVFPSS